MNNLCQSFFNKVAGLRPTPLLRKRPATLLKKRLWHSCFPVNFVKFLRTTFYIKYLWRLLLCLFSSSFFLFKLAKTHSLYLRALSVSKFQLRTKFTYFQYNYAVQLAILKHLYLNHFCLFSYSMVITGFRYLLQELLD